MRKLTKNIISISLITCAILAAFSISLGKALFNLNSTQLDIGGDGFKNYFTFAYQYKYGEGIHFDGLMYPYGDLAIYTDCQILFVWFLKALKVIGLDSEAYLLGIVNTLPILGFILAAFILLKIFEHYQVEPKQALFFSIVCVLLSPQIFRIQSHYALSYAYVIPALWLFNIHIKKSDSLLLLAASLCFVFLHGFVHPYLLFICSLFSLSLFLSKVVFRWTPIPIWTLIQGILPIGCFLLLMNFIDPVSDRPINPYGIMINKTEVSDLFPFFGWFKMVAGDSFDLRSGYTEGYAYPGFLFLLVPILFLAKYILSLRLSYLPKITIHRDHKSYFLASIFCLSLGMGLHIILTNELILELIPKLKQFRTLGRTSWVFYYVCFVAFAILFYKLTNKLKPKLRILLQGIVILAMLSDIYAYHKNLGEGISKYGGNDRIKGQTIIADLLTEKGLGAKDFQAQFVLPSSTEGAEKLSFKDDWDSKQGAFPFAFQTGLPMTSIVMSRASISNSLKILQLSSSNYISREVISDFTSDKPLLVIIQNDKEELFRDLLSKGILINQNEKISLYNLDISSLKAFDKIPHSIIDSIDSELPPNTVFYDFETGHSDGLESAHALLINGSEEIFDAQVRNEEDTQYSLSLWYKILPDKTNVPHFNIQTFGKDGQLRFSGYFRDWDMRRVEVYGSWIRLLQNYTLTNEDARIKLIAHGEYLSLDRVLLKPDKYEVVFPCIGESVIQYNHTIGIEE